MPLDWTPARCPSPVVLEGRTVRLEPLRPEHADDLLAAQPGDPALFAYLPYGPFPDPEEHRAHVAALAAAPGLWVFALVDPATARVGGHAALMRCKPGHGAIEVGHVLVTPALQRTPPATEAVFLLARHVFEDLGHRRFEWKCDAANARSRRAAERFGFTFEGVFRQHMVVQGRNRDTAWFSLLDREWPAARAAFAAWLDPANFDADGRQRQRLAALRGMCGRAAGHLGSMEHPEKLAEDGPRGDGLAEEGDARRPGAEAEDVIREQPRGRAGLAEDAAPDAKATPDPEELAKDGPRGDGLAEDA